MLGFLTNKAHADPKQNDKDDDEGAQTDACHQRHAIGLCARKTRMEAVSSEPERLETVTSQKFKPITMVICLHLTECIVCIFSRPS
jgi:hypothetical protein